MRIKFWRQSAKAARIVGTVFVVLGPLLVASCGSMVGTGCTAELRSVIQLDALDSISLAPGAAGATVWLRGPFSDSLTVPDTATSSLVHLWFEDRVTAGTYSLQIRKAGYRDWARTGIRIDANRCHTTTFDHVTALLQH